MSFQNSEAKSRDLKEFALSFQGSVDVVLMPLISMESIDEKRD